MNTQTEDFDDDKKVHNLKQLAEAYKNDNKDFVVMFGKHFGLKIKDLPVQYTEWATKTVEADE